MESCRILVETEVYETPEVEVYPSGPVHATHSYSHIDGIPSSDINEIDRAPLRPADAFHAFLGASVPQDEIKVVPRGELENPTMRYHRLQQELGELERDLELLENVSKNSTDPPTYRTMLQGLKTLQANLSQLHLDLTAPSHDTPHIQAQQHLSAQIWKDIDAFRQHAAKQPVGEKNPSLVYEVYAVQEQDKSATLKLAAIEQRIAQLERLVGSSHDTKSMLQSIQEIETRLSLLQPTQLESLATRVTALLNDFTAISKLQETSSSVQQAITTAQESSQLNAMYEQLQTVSVTAAGFPALVERLASLKHLHDEASTFSQRLQALERNTEQLSTILQTDSELLKNMESNLSRNLTVFQSNMETLDQRMQALLQK